MEFIAIYQLLVFMVHTYCAGNGGMSQIIKLYTKAKVLRSCGMSTLKDSENINKRLNIKLKGFEYDRKFVFSNLAITSNHQRLEHPWTYSIKEV